MKLEEFRALPEEKKMLLINERLQELGGGKKLVEEFRNETLEFSYSSAMKEMHSLGYARVGKKLEKEVKLNDYQVSLLTTLAYDYEFMMNRKENQPKVEKRNDDQIVTTSVRMYNKVWKRWQEFSKEWSIYNSVDLMASALEEYMNRLDFADYDTLMDQGKIKDSEKK